jgi:hypothetical protein
MDGRDSSILEIPIFGHKKGALILGRQKISDLPSILRLSQNQVIAELSSFCVAGLPT